MSSPHVSIAITTFRRPEELLALLGTLEVALRAVDSGSYRVIVVDNDPTASARSVCEAAEVLDLEYFHQPKPGISATRNAAISAAFGSDFIVFVDDDELVTRDWLAELLRVQTATEADMVAGPVLSRLPEDAPDYVKDSGIFDQPSRPDASFLPEAGSGNLLCRYELFSSRAPSEWFQEAFGLTGGEDAELTRRFHREGAQIAWAAHAVAYERVPLSRASVTWLSRRYRRIGAVDYRLDTMKRARRVRGIATGVARMVTAAPPLAWTWLTRRSLNGAAFRRLFRGVGYIEAAVFGGYSEYRR